MIYEFAISPTLCIDYRDLRFFLQSFGYGEGRLFSDIPRKKWMRMARQEIKASDNGQVEKKRLTAAVEKLSRKALYCRNTVPELGDEPWLYHALAAHADRPFKAILTGGYEGEDACVLSCNQDFTSDTKWKIPLDAAVERTSEKMIQAIHPMLDCAREVVLIDRNFDPDKYRWRRFLIKLTELLSRRTFSPSIRKIDFHFGDRISIHQLQVLCANHITTKMPADMKVNCFVWPRSELHDRYVLTDVGGIRFGIGLDIWDGSGPKEVEISRISDETRLRWWHLCKNKAATFTIP